MRDLQLQLDDRDFEQLVELGRSLIPTLAPEWTDHNIHDPGITFLELLAWTAEAQIYALGRMRRDERLAYAALMGLRPRGPAPARGMVWLDKIEADQAIPAGSVILAQRPDAPLFRTCHAVQVSAAQIKGVSTRFADGRIRQWPPAFAASVPSFRPFGDAPAGGDCLMLELDGPLPVCGAHREAGHLSLGFAIDAPALPPEPPTDAPPRHRIARLEAFIEDEHGRQHLPIHRDGTDGLLHSGVILLAPPARAADRCRLLLRSRRGMLVRPPDVRRIALNVLDIEQLRAVEDVLPYPFGQDMPDQSHRIPDPPARLHPLGRPDEVQMNGRNGETTTWHYRRDLSECRPEDLAYSFEASSGTLRFGNGINGAMPPRGAQLVVRYRVTEGSRGALPAGVRWGIQGLTGSNPDPVSGGRDASTLEDLRREALHARRTAHPLVTPRDLEAAAESFAELGVSRARELAPRPDDPTTPPGTRRLIVVGRAEGPRPIVESAAWLDEIRDRLAPSLPLGQRLEVNAPRYVPIRIRARLMCAHQVAPNAVARDVREALAAHLALVPRTADDPVWPLGRAIYREDVLGWLRVCPNVTRVTDLEVLAGGQAMASIALGDADLPRYVGLDGDIQVVAPTHSGVRR